MINFLLECILLAVCTGASTAVYYHVLRYKYPISYLSKFFNDREGKSWTCPLWFCVPCIAGQLSLWSYITFKGSYGWDNLLTLILGGVYTICMAIFVAMWTGRAITKINNNQ